ncbi:MAG: septum formation initiator family protein [Syntrophobacterales bacterium]|nr:septum formation initiator family protein [Syntrophobacterales bacterium]
MTTDAAPGRGLTGWGGYKGLAVGAILCLVAVIGVAVFSRQGVWEISRLRQELQRLEWENARLAQENRRLALTIERLQHDPHLIQDHIRRELNFLRKNELILHLPEDQAPVVLPAERHKPPPSAKPEAKHRSRAGHSPAPPRP